MTSNKNQLEHAVETELVRFAEQRRCLCLKVKIDGRRGFPDRLIITPDGVQGYAETKRPVGGKLSPHQKHWRKELEKRNCFYSAPCTKEDAKQFVHFLLRKSK